MAKTRETSLRLEQSLYERLQKLAESQNRTVAFVIRELLEQGLKRSKQRQLRRS